LETKNQRLVDDFQLADSFTNSQAERITQMEAEIKQLVDKLNQLNSDAERLRADNARLTTNADELKDQNSKLEEEIKELQSAFNASEVTKMELHKVIEDRISEYSKHLEELRNQKVSIIELSQFYYLILGNL
jgi:chromosome segregation ATPase